MASGAELPPVLAPCEVDEDEDVDEPESGLVKLLGLPPDGLLADGLPTYDSP